MAATTISAQIMSSASCPMLALIRNPMPTVGLPKNSATMAPIKAKVDAIFKPLNTNGMAAASGDRIHQRITTAKPSEARALRRGAGGKQGERD